MADFNSNDRLDSEVEQSLVKLLLGFFGVTAAILLLPKTLKVLMRKWFLGLIGEVVAVIITGLLTEKMVDWVSRENALTGDRTDLPRSPTGPGVGSVAAPGSPAAGSSSSS